MNCNYQNNQRCTGQGSSTPSTLESEGQSQSASLEIAAQCDNTTCDGAGSVTQNPNSTGEVAKTQRRHDYESAQRNKGREHTRERAAYQRRFKERGLRTSKNLTSEESVRLARRARAAHGFEGQSHLMQRTARSLGITRAEVACNLNRGGVEPNPGPTLKGRKVEKCPVTGKTFFFADIIPFVSGPRSYNVCPLCKCEVKIASRHGHKRSWHVDDADIGSTTPDETPLSQSGSSSEAEETPLPAAAVAETPDRSESPINLPPKPVPPPVRPISGSPAPGPQVLATTQKTAPPTPTPVTKSKADLAAEALNDEDAVRAVKLSRRAPLNGYRLREKHFLSFLLFCGYYALRPSQTMYVTQMRKESRVVSTRKVDAEDADHIVAVLRFSAYKGPSIFSWLIGLSLWVVRHFGIQHNPVGGFLLGLVIRASRLVIFISNRLGYWESKSIMYSPHSVASVVSELSSDSDLETVRANARARLNRLGSLPIPDSHITEIMHGSQRLIEFLAPNQGNLLDGPTVPLRGGDIPIVEELEQYDVSLEVQRERLNLDIKFSPSGTGLGKWVYRTQPAASWIPELLVLEGLTRFLIVRVISVVFLTVTRPVMDLYRLIVFTLWCANAAWQSVYSVICLIPTLLYCATWACLLIGSCYLILRVYGLIPSRSGLITLPTMRIEKSSSGKPSVVFEEDSQPSDSARTLPSSSSPSDMMNTRREDASTPELMHLRRSLVAFSRRLRTLSTRILRSLNTYLFQTGHVWSMLCATRVTTTTRMITSLTRLISFCASCDALSSGRTSFSSKGTPVKRSSSAPLSADSTDYGAPASPPGSKPDACQETCVLVSATASPTSLSTSSSCIVRGEKEPLLSKETTGSLPAPSPSAKKTSPGLDSQ